MTECTVVLKFWDSVTLEIREIMISKDMNPEVDGIEDIIHAVEQAETQLEARAQAQGKRMENEKPTPKCEWTCFKNRMDRNRNYRPSDREQKPSQMEKIRANTVSPQNMPEQKGKFVPRNNNNIKKLLRSKLDELRAQGKCFNCYETGHKQRNCPKLNAMKPPKPAVRTSTVNLSKMDKLAEKKDRADIYVGRVSIKEDSIKEELEEIELRVHRMCEEAWGEDPLWYNKETRPDCRWSVGADDLEITIWDFENGGNRIFSRDDLDNPSFKIAKIFEAPKTDRNSTAVQEGGFPIIDEYNQWDWPAVNWLQARLLGQLDYVDKGNTPTGTPNEKRIDVQPMMFRYSVQLDESNIIYDLTHEEVLDQRFSPEKVIDQLLEARKVPVTGGRGGVTQGVN